MMVCSYGIWHSNLFLTVFVETLYKIFIVWNFLQKPSRTQEKTHLNAAMTWWKDPWAGHILAEKEPHLRVIVLSFQECSFMKRVLMFVYLSGLISRALPRDGLHGESKERPLITGSIMQGNAFTCRNTGKCVKCWQKSEILFSFLGTPRTTAESYEEALKYGKQIKRESPPIRSFEGGISKGKPYEGVNTIKELGRSIHEIPRQDPSGQDLRKTPELSDRRIMEV